MSDLRVEFKIEKAWIAARMKQFAKDTSNSGRSIRRKLYIRFVALEGFLRGDKTLKETLSYLNLVSP